MTEEPRPANAPEGPQPAQVAEPATGTQPATETQPAHRY